MPRGTVAPAEGCGDLPEPPRVSYGVGRGGHAVEILSPEINGRRFVRLLRGPGKGSTYHLPVDELTEPAVQPFITLPSDDLPHDRWDLPMTDSPTCPHALRSNRELDYDADLGCWVHADPACRRPQAEHLRAVLRSDGGIFA